MSKKLKKIKNRIVQSLQANYSIRDSEQKIKSTSANRKLRTLICEKIDGNNTSKLNPRSKRVYLTNINESLPNKDPPAIHSQKEENMHTINSQTKHRYITRVKSSNAGTMQHDRSFTNERNMRQTSKLNRVIKNLNEVQFQSQLYWNGSGAYLVTGVKNQYEKMKKSYEEKCLEIEKIKKEYNVDQIKEMKIYIDKLQKENTKLIEACEKFRNKMHKERQAHSSLSGLVLEKYQTVDLSQGAINQLNQLYEKMEKFQSKIVNLQNKNSILLKQQKKLVTKIFLQEKLIIDKENCMFRSKRECKKLQKYLEEIKQKLKENQESTKKLEEENGKKVEQVKALLKQDFLAQKKNFIDKLRQNQTKIEKMNKEIIHLKNLLTSWKREDQSEFNQDFNQEQQGPLNSRQQNSQLTKYYNSKLNIDKSMDYLKVNKDKIKIKFKNSIENDLPSNSLGNQGNTGNLQSQRSLNKSGFRNRGQDGRVTDRSTQKTIKKQRERVTAKTHKEGSIRSRTVEINQVQPIIEYIKLKLAFKRIDPSQLTHYFDFHPSIIEQNKYVSLSQIQKQKFYQQMNSLTKKQIFGQTKKEIYYQNDSLHPIIWEQQYINIKEVYDALLKVPFEIRENEALLLSRFIVQDVKEPYVYMNWDSQNSRRMIKSIISNLLSFESLNDKTIEKSEDLLKKYETVLIPALKSVTAKTGKVSKDKFIQILNGLGLERTKYMDEYIIGKMCCASLGLEELQFSSLYSSNSSNQ